MPPEQARGEAVDARTDLFSLEAVVYEMATGTRAFPKALDWTMPAAAGMPPALQRTVFKLLEPDVDLRYQTAADAIADLKRLQRATESADTSHRRWLAPVGAVVIMAALAMAVIGPRTDPLPPGRDRWVRQRSMVLHAGVSVRQISLEGYAFNPKIHARRQETFLPGVQECVRVGRDKRVMDRGRGLRV